MSGNLLNAIYDRRDPGSEAFRFADGPTRSTGELRELVGKMSSALRSFAVGRGDRVSFKLEKTEEVLVLAHACLQLGAILHPLNTGNTDIEIADLVGDASPRLLVCDREEVDRLKNSLRTTVVVSLAPGMGGTLGEAARALGPLGPVCEMATDDVAALLYTSGTTGLPKGASITHGNLVESALALAKIWDLKPSDRLLHALPMFHAHGLLTAVNSMLVAGASVLFVPRFDASDVIRLLPETSVIMGVPTHYARLLKETGLAPASRHLRLVVSGSAPLSKEVSERFYELTGHQIIERYGATETAIVTAVPAGTLDRTGFVGWPLPGVEIRVAQPNGQRASCAASGSLETRGHNVFAGYWKRPLANAEAFTDDGWFVTGDLAAIDETGCVRLLGRSRDLIITGGLNVYPREVENALDELLVGSESSVFGVPHPDFGEAVVAVVEAEEICEHDLVRDLRTRLAAYKVPKRILPIPSIPRNRMGKVLKHQLRNLHADLFIDKPQ